MQTTTTNQTPLAAIRYAKKVQETKAEIAATVKGWETVAKQHRDFESTAEICRIMSNLVERYLETK